MPFSSGTTVRWIGLRDIEAKLAAAAPNILAENRSMATEMLEMVKAELESTPGYRSSLKVEVTSKGLQTSGSLKGAPRAYWRNFGTYGSFVGGSVAVRGYIKALKRQGGTMAGGGEPALMLAAKALSKVKGMIRLYYGKAQWWRL